MPTTTRPFDMAEQLRDEQDIAAYLTLVLEEGDPGELAHALGVIARARGMTQIAAEAGVRMPARALKPSSRSCTRWGCASACNRRLDVAPTLTVGSARPGAASYNKAP